jgi:hypothetical protein
MRKAVVVDTNVLVTAEGGPAHSLQCAKYCTNKLLEIQKQGCVALDTGWEILKEYQTNLSGRRQPGVGFRFWQWLLNTRANPELCSWVTITVNESRGYEEFPDHDGLRRFDPADRKFVAVAALHPNKPPIIQATDSKWVGWKKPLAECGIEVEFVCKDEIEAKYKKKVKHA